MNSKTTKRRHKISVIAFLLSATIFLQGCVVFLTTVATVVRMRSSNHVTTTVLIKKEPDVVYAAMIQILERKPDVKVIKKEDASYLIEAARGEAKASAKATSYGSGLTQLIVTADAGKGDQSDEDLALNVVKQICEELKVGYKVVES
jgi:hypothetical protein